MSRNPETFAAWALKSAPPSTLINMAFPRVRQVEVARVLGVPQSSVSMWRSGKAGMSRPVRAHLLRILGVARDDGAWRLCETIVDRTEPPDAPDSV